MAAPSPTQEKLDLISYEVLVGGTELSGENVVKEIVVQRELNRIPTAKIVIVDGDPSDESFALSESDTFKPGTEIEIKAGYHQDVATIFKGVVISQNARIRGRGEVSDLTVICKDKATSMTISRHNAFFVKKTDNEIIEELISKHGLTPNVEATAALPATQREVIQYNVTDWDFMMMRADFNGRIVSVVDGTVNVNKPKVSEAGVISLKHGTSIISSDLGVNAESQVSKVVAKGWDYSANAVVESSADEPQVPAQGNLKGEELSSTLADTEIELHSPAPMDAQYLKEWANAKLQRARLALITGRVVSYGTNKVLPDQTITLEGMGARLNGDAYVSGVFHRIKDGSWITEFQIGLSEKSFAETQPNIQAGAGSGVIPGIEGLHIGIVKQIHDDPDGEFRIHLDVPMVDPSGDGIWARQSTYYGTNENGNFYYPEIGDEAIVGFLNNDPMFPVILGYVYGKTHVPAYTPDADNTYKALVTKSLMKIEFEDVKRILTIWTPNENYMIFSDDEGSITIEDENKNKVVMDAAGINMYTPKDFVLKADANISMEAGQSISMKSGTDFAAEAGTNMDLKASIGFTAKGTTAELNGSGQAVVKGGMVMIN